MDIREAKKAQRLREWAEMVRACKSSGQSVAAWCDKNSINTKTYYYRQKQVVDALPELQAQMPNGLTLPGGKTTTSFVEVLPPEGAEPSGAITIQLHGARITVGENADVALLENVLLAVSRTC